MGIKKRNADLKRRLAPSICLRLWVWLSAKKLPRLVTSRKLAPCYIGSFKILSTVKSFSYQLALPHSMRVNPTFHISQLTTIFCYDREPWIRPDAQHRYTNLQRGEKQARFVWSFVSCWTDLTSIQGRGLKELTFHISSFQSVFLKRNIKVIQFMNIQFLCLSIVDIFFCWEKCVISSSSNPLESWIWQMFLLNRWFLAKG